MAFSAFSWSLSSACHHEQDTLWYSFHLTHSKTNSVLTVVLSVRKLRSVGGLSQLFFMAVVYFSVVETQTLNKSIQIINLGMGRNVYKEKNTKGASWKKDDKCCKCTAWYKNIQNPGKGKVTQYHLAYFPPPWPLLDGIIFLYDYNFVIA